METTLSVGELVQQNQIRIRSIWPPYRSMSKLVLVLVTKYAAQRILKLDDSILENNEWYLEAGEPCLILGEAFFAPDGKYHARPTYQLLDAVTMTKQFAKGPPKPQTRQQQEQKSSDALLKEIQEYKELEKILAKN